MQGNATPHPGAVLSSFLQHLAQLLLIIAPHDADDAPPFLHHPEIYNLEFWHARLNYACTRFSTSHGSDRLLGNQICHWTMGTSPFPVHTSPCKYCYPISLLLVSLGFSRLLGLRPPAYALVLFLRFTKQGITERNLSGGCFTRFTFCATIAFSSSCLKQEYFKISQRGHTEPT